MIVCQKLVDGGYVPHSAAAQMYITPDKTRTIIKKFAVVNPSGGAVTITVWLVPRQGTTGDTSLIVNAFSVPTNGGRATELTELQGQDVPTGAMIWMQAGAANALVAHVTGLEMS